MRDISAGWILASLVAIASLNVVLYYHYGQNNHVIKECTPITLYKEDLEEITTKPKCVLGSNWGGFCAIENVCINSKGLFYIESEHIKNSKIQIKTLPVAGGFFDDNDELLNTSQPYTAVPGYTINTIEGEKLLLYKDVWDEKWHDEPIYILKGSASDLSNPLKSGAHFAFPLFYAWASNITFSLKLPPVGRVILNGVTSNDPNIENSWGMKILKELILDPSIPIQFQDQFESYQKTEENQLDCYRRAVFTTEVHLLHEGVFHGRQFRDLAKKWGLLNRVSLPNYNAPPTVLILDRTRESGGYIQNLPEVEAILQKYTLEYRIVRFDSPEYIYKYKEQASEVFNTPLVIAAHSDDLVNMIFMPFRSVLIELYPYGITRPTYRKLANVMQLNYWPVHATEISTESFNEQQIQELERTCLSESFLKGEENPECSKTLQKGAVVVPIMMLETVLLEACDFLGSKKAPRQTWNATTGLAG